ncbi:hypothetical protein GCG21_08690 [Pseudactinotalea sp. HY160]|uniref:hypothetical protein n=1 Tax=Pseudactinotalea sp. HY160 TaxID=2654490 RepID=UPI00128E71BA|nr:hypothetical protein [Pseudactinotalea sp. HY160]MPV50081.1 hypothetical protein [Pseudactinotalea sp. HY160]
MSIQPAPRAAVSRQPAGTPAGGQFAQQGRPAAGVALSSPRPPRMVAVTNVTRRRVGGMVPGRDAASVQWDAELADGEMLSINSTQIAPGSTHSIAHEPAPRRGEVYPDEDWGQIEGFTSREDAEQALAGHGRGRGLIIELN